MKVHELIDYLRSFNPESEIWVSGDEEGNDFHPLSSLSEEFLDRTYGEIVDVDDEDDPNVELIVVAWP